MLANPTAGLTKPSSVRLENNEYTGIVVAIHPNETEDERLIEAIREMVNDASSYLYEATNHRAYFKEVMILIPDTWEDKPGYQSPRNATFEGADIIVAPRNPRFAPEPSLPPVPHTKHYEGCGKQSVHIHLTSHFLLHEYTEAYYGNIGRVLVHEWGHYRWGLFNEYADEIADPDHSQEFYFSPTKQVWVPTRCSLDWESYSLVFDNGRYRYCNGDKYIGYEDGCVSIPSTNQDRVTASIMSGYTSVDEIIDFCDDNVESSEIHNTEAPDKHNRLCNSRSNWEIMREHPDFKDGKNPPQNISDVTPTIILARMKPIRVVMVLDTSGSMSTNDRISKLAGSARNYVTSVAVDGSYIGIVDFDSTGKKLSGLTLIDSDQARRDLAQLIPTEAAGGTCIGCGLETALEIFSENGTSPAGGLVLLITDGQDGNSAKTEQFKDIYVEENLVIDAVAFSNTAEENLIDLQEATGGKFFLQTDDPGSTGLHDAFLATMESGVQEYDRRVELYADSSYYEVTESRSHGVYIDPTVGRKTSFDFSYIVDTPRLPVEVVITSPSGNVYNSTYEGYGTDLTYKTISVKFETAESGLWSYVVSNTHFTGHEVFVSISTYASQEGVDPITATSEISGSVTDFANGEPLIAFAEVKQGFYPVIRANVIATIERPPDANGVPYDPIELQLLDNGAGADVTRDDGIYSRYFTEFSGVGYYGIKVNINNDNGTAIILNPGTQIPYSRTLAFVDPEELLKGNLPTIGNTTVLLPGMPVPEPDGEPAPKFTRGVSGGSSRVPSTPTNWVPGNDITAPSKVVDLRVTSSSYDNASVTLEFTAPGDDLDSGSASYYVIRQSDSAVELQTNYSFAPVVDQTDILLGNLTSPGEFGDLEVFVIQVDVPENQSVVTYTFALHAVDESGNEGAISNLAQATLREYIPPAPTTLPTTTTTSTTSPPTEKITATPVVDPKNFMALYITLGVAGGALILVLLTFLVAQCCLKKKQKVKDVSDVGANEPKAYDNNAYNVYNI